MQETSAAGRGSGGAMCSYPALGAGGVWYEGPVKAPLVRFSHLQSTTEQSLNTAGTYISVCIYTIVPSGFVLIYERAVHQVS